MRILIVDDLQEVRELVKDLASEIFPQVKIFEASDPQEGLKIFHECKGKLNLAICDYYMPVDNGVELCKIIKSNSKNVKTILYTGNASRYKDELESTIDYYVSKDEGMESLKQVLLTFK